MAHKKFGGLKKSIKKLENCLTTLQKGPVSAEFIEKCSSISAEIEDLRRKEESFWYIRARANELRDGDKNTSYFYHKSSQRRKKTELKGC